MRRLSLTIVWLGFFSGNASAAETDPDGRLFHPSEDPVADVQQAIEQADEKDRLALVVLGANWCHDSRALAARLYRSPLADTIQEHYELVLVDVGFYELDSAVLQQLVIPQYYATPTVVIVDPSSGQPVNNDDRHIWGNAYRIDMESSVEYFDKMGNE